MHEFNESPEKKRKSKVVVGEEKDKAASFDQEEGAEGAAGASGGAWLMVRLV